MHLRCRCDTAQQVARFLMVVLEIKGLDRLPALDAFRTFLAHASLDGIAFEPGNSSDPNTAGRLRTALSRVDAQVGVCPCG